MPLPRGPRRSWRPLVEGSLALFNAAAVISLAVWWHSHSGERSDYRGTEARALAGAALLGAIGFLGWFSYKLRLRMILASGLFWVVIGAVTLLCGLSPFPYVLRLLGREYDATMSGVVFVAVGIASVATFRSRDRTRWDHGARRDYGNAGSS